MVTNTNSRFCNINLLFAFLDCVPLLCADGITWYNVAQDLYNAGLYEEQDNIIRYDFACPSCKTRAYLDFDKYNEDPNHRGHYTILYLNLVRWAYR